MLARINKKMLFAVLLAVFSVELISTAWISDDAAITLRTVLNFIHGYGMTFNMDERVQAYTHPLWFFALTLLTLITKNVFTSTFILSIATSALVFWLFLTRAGTRTGGVLAAGLVFILSKAYVEFSTSGLENPLSHLIILCAVVMAIRAVDKGDIKSIVPFFFSCALLYLNRPDLLVLMAPIAVLVIVRHKHSPGQLLKGMWLGALPVILWTAFSIYYYGFPFPNTAYAKIATGIALDERIIQGGKYLLHIIYRDPVTIAFIVVGVLLGIGAGSVAAVLAISILAYLFYILTIGGDFMEGRFLTAPLLVAGIQVARATLSKVQHVVLAAVMAALGMVGIQATLLSGSDFRNFKIFSNGIADERGIYYPTYGLLAASKEVFAEPSWALGEHRVAIICGGLGFNAIAAGPSTHYIDSCALADPLLARLPAKYNPAWRIGHFERQLPTDYKDSIVQGKNLVTDPATHTFYDAIRLITRGELNDPARLKAILLVNLGRIPLPDRAMYAYQSIPKSSKVETIAASRLATPLDGGPWDTPGAKTFTEALEITFDQPVSFSEIDMSADHNDVYRIEVFTEQGFVPIATVEPAAQVGLVRHRIKLAVATPITRKVRVVAVSGDDAYSVGHFIVR